MFEQGYFVTAELRVKPHASIQETRSALKTLCQDTLNEPGCSLFTLHHCQEDERRFLLWERFDDEAAFKAHFMEPHTQSFIARDLTEIVQFFQSNVVDVTHRTQA